MDVSRYSQWAAAPDLPPPSTSASTQGGRPSLLEEAEVSVCRPSIPDRAEPSSRRRSMPDIEEPSQPPEKRTPSSDPESYSSVSTNIYSDVFSFKGAKEVFNINYTFIRALLTSSEVRYQLSTTLEQDTRELRIRRLAPSETRRLATDPSTPLRFEEDRTLYTLHKDPSNSAVRVVGLKSETRIDCISKRWRVYHVTENKNIDMLYKVGQKGLEWEDEAGRVVAKETCHPGDRYDLWPYVLKLDADMDEKSTDLLVACWVGRMWYWGWDSSAVRL